MQRQVEIDNSFIILHVNRKLSLTIKTACGIKNIMPNMPLWTQITYIGNANPTLFKNVCKKCIEKLK